MPTSRHRRANPTALVAAYRLLAFTLAERTSVDQTVHVRAWEQPSLGTVMRSPEEKSLRVRLPGRAVLASKTLSSDDSVHEPECTTMWLIPDLGSTPVAGYREMLRRLIVYFEVSGDRELQLVVATVDPDGEGRRGASWLTLLDRLGAPLAPGVLNTRVIHWEQVMTVVGNRKHSASAYSGVADLCAFPGGSSATRRAGPIPTHAREQVLHLVGRHPFLTTGQLAQLLGKTTTSVKRLESDLVEAGLLRRLDFDEMDAGQVDLTRDEFCRLCLVEVTSAGRRQLAASLGIETTAAARYHGLIGSGRRDTGRRRRLLHTLAHTIGANGVFVALAVAADVARRSGSTECLTEWRSAAACERRHCKPDGYGCYRRDGRKHGFFLEYDRGTESGRKYAAKFRSYYRYRDSRQAERDFEGFPTVVFVTTRPAAEYRIAEHAYRASCARAAAPLRVLTTTTERISGAPKGLLDRVWQRHDTDPRGSGRNQLYWLFGD
jgi:hypothetical protein